LPSGASNQESNQSSAGEVADPRFRQVITSAVMGAAAAMEAEKYLAEHETELVFA
jgi:thioredoxin reductase